MGNRKAFVSSFLADLDAICPGHKNEVFYVPLFDSLTDEEFERMVLAIEAGELCLPLVMPNGSTAKLNTKRAIKVGRSWGHEFREYVKLTDPINPGLVYQTPKKALIIKLPCRRQAQTWEDKHSIPKDDYSIDDLTGQVTNGSKGSGISGPESQILYTHDLKAVLVEFLKVRGGDELAYRKMEQDLIATGRATLADSATMGTKVRAAETIGIQLTSVHLGNNLVKEDGM